MVGFNSRSKGQIRARLEQLRFAISEITSSLVKVLLNCFHFGAGYRIYLEVAQGGVLNLQNPIG